VSAISGTSAAASVASTASTASAATLPATSMPLIDPALEPAVVRNGNTAAKNAYATGVAFEDMLVNQLAQEMSATVPGLDGSSDGLGGTSDDGLGGTDASGGDQSSLGGSSLGAYSSLLPQTLATAIESGGGTGMALQIAQSIDPALAHPASKGTP
jgi:hypothetical protein